MAETISTEQLFGKDTISTAELFGGELVSTEELFGETISTEELFREPARGPEVVPPPKGQMKIYEMLGSMPAPLSSKVKQKAIERQIGTIANEPPNLFKSVIKGAKNIPQNIKDIVTETGSLIMDIGRFGWNTKGNYIDDLNSMFVKKEGGFFTKTREGFEPVTDLVMATTDDWDSILKGENPTELEKTPIGKATQQVIGDVDEQGFRKYLYGMIEERPVDMLLIGNAVKSAVGRGVRLTAQGTRKIVKDGTKFADKLDEFVSTERKPIVFDLPVETDGTVSAAKSVEFPRKYSKDPLTKYMFEGSFDAMMDKFPKFQAAVANQKANKLINNMRNKYDEQGFRERAALHKEIAENIETLSPDELKVMVPYLEGRASLITDPTNEFKAFETYYRNLTTKIGEDYSRMGKLDSKTIEARLYQPIAKATGQSTEQVIAEFGDFTPAYVHHTFPDRFGDKLGIHFTDTTGKRYNPDSLKRSKGVAGYSENLEEILPKWTSEYVKFKNTQAFLDDFTGKFGIPVNIKDVKNVPGGLEVAGKKYTGYKILAPDGYLSFYQQKIDFYKEVSKRMDNMTFDEAIGEVVSETVTRTAGTAQSSRGTQLIETRVREALEQRGFATGEVTQMIERVKSGDAAQIEIVRERMVKSGINPEQVKEAFRGVEKVGVGVSKNKKVYLVPESQAKQLESFATPLFGSQKIQNAVKIIYDRPQQVWKDSVLAASPRWIKNNVMGDIIFNTMEGVGPLSYGRAFNKKYTELIPESLLRISFANVMKYNPKLGSAAKTTVGGLVDALDKTKVVKGIAKVKDTGYAINTMIEQPFVRALYISEARKKAIAMLRSQKKPLTEGNIIDTMGTIKDVPKLRDPIIAKVKETLPVFDDLNNFERKYVRRAVPFYNWFKFMAKYGKNLPANHPFKTVGGRGLGGLSETHRETAFIQTFPFMEDEIKENGIPDRYDNLWPIKVDKNGEATFFNARGLNVFSTIEDIVNLNIGNMLSPILKVGGERALGVEAFSRRNYSTGDEGIDFEEHKKHLPPLSDHILKNFPQYTLLKQFRTPARQDDSGTLFNPKPVLDKITGEYVFPIDDVEKFLNFLGIDKRTVNIRDSWERFQNKKRAAISKTFKKYQSTIDTSLSFSEIDELFREIKKNPKQWERIQKEIEREKKLKGGAKKKLYQKVKEQSQ